MVLVIAIINIAVLRLSWQAPPPNPNGRVCQLWVLVKSQVIQMWVTLLQLSVTDVTLVCVISSLLCIEWSAQCINVCHFVTQWFVILHKLSVYEVTVVRINLHELHDTDTPILPKREPSMISKWHSRLSPFNVYYMYQASCESSKV